MTKRLTVAVFAIDDIDNIGDELLGDVTKRVVDKEFPHYVVRRVSLMPDAEMLSIKERFFQKTALRVYQARHLFPRFCWPWVKNLSYRLRHLLFSSRLRYHYRKNLEGVDAAITAVGMFKYSTQNLSYAYDVLTEELDRFGIPLLISAASVQSFDPDDWRSRRLKQAVNRSCVNVMTTRDGAAGLKRLRESYIMRQDIKTAAVEDPASLLPIFFAEAVNPNRCGIGINMPRFRLMSDYGNNITDEELFSFYKQFLVELDRRSIPWKLFCNGMMSDYRFGEKLLIERRDDMSKLVPPDKSIASYVKTVTGFKSVFALRFHSVLTAYYFGVPLMAFCWDDKVRLFGKGRSLEHFYECDELNAGRMAERVAELMSRKETSGRRINYATNSLRLSIVDFLSGVGGDRNNLLRCMGA